MKCSTNYVITAVWALAFAVMVAADLLLIYMPDLPARFGIIPTVLALVGAFKFNAYYPERRRGEMRCDRRSFTSSNRQPSAHG